jgi:hypothetical protein
MDEILEGIIAVEERTTYDGNMPLHNKHTMRAKLNRDFARANENKSGMVAQRLYSTYGLGDWTPADEGEAPMRR